MKQRQMIVFGNGTYSDLAVHSLIHDAGREVAAHCVDADYVGDGMRNGRPVLAFEQLPLSHPPADFDMLIPLGWGRMNTFRQERFIQAKTMGYRIGNFVSSLAETWQGVAIKENVILFEHSNLQPFVRLGENVTVRAGANLGHHATVGSHTFIASSVVTGGNVTIGEYCFIGLGAILRDGICIGDRCFIGAGAVVIGDTEPDSVYVGNPARKLDKTPLEVTGG